MDKSVKKVCCLFGQKYSNECEEKLKHLLANQIEKLVKNGYSRFTIIGEGKFDKLVKEVFVFLSDKNKNNDKKYHVELYHVSLSYQYGLPTNNYEQNTDSDYPETNDVIIDIYKTFRNFEIVDNSDFCIFYVKSKHGNTFHTLKYAKKQQKSHINLFDLCNI